MGNESQKRAGRIVREIRERLDLDRETFAMRVQWSLSKLTHVEDGEIPYKRAYLDDLVMAGVVHVADVAYESLKSIIEHEAALRKQSRQAQRSRPESNAGHSAQGVK